MDSVYVQRTPFQQRLQRPKKA